jgi:Holliday junction resolvase RusA-like endonuclease
MDMGAPVETVIRICVPGAPKAWQRAGDRIVTPKGGGKQFVHHFTQANTRSEQGVLRMFAVQAMGGKPPFAGPMDLRLAVFLPIAPSWSKKKQAEARAGLIRPIGKPDFDNFLKQIDAFKGIIWIDDSQVTDQACWLRYSDQPRLVFEVRPIVLGAA